MKALRRIPSFLRHVILYGLLLLYLSPFFFVLVNSFKTRREILSNPFGLPPAWSLTNFITAFQRMGFVSAFFNSLVITVFSVAGIAIFSAMTAYLFVPPDWRFNKVMFFAAVAAMLIPSGDYDSAGANLRRNGSSKQPLIQSTCTLVLAHPLRSSLLVSSIERAGRSGHDCGYRLQVFSMVFPLLKSTTLSLVILNVLWIWNDFLLPSLVLISADKRTLPLTTFYFHGTYTSDYGLLMAALMLTIVPVIVFYSFLQKHIL